MRENWHILLIGVFIGFSFMGFTAKYTVVDELVELKELVNTCELQLPRVEFCELIAIPTKNGGGSGG